MLIGFVSGEVLDPYIPKQYDEKTLLERAKGLPQTVSSW